MESAQTSPGYPPITSSIDQSAGNKKKILLIVGVISLFLFLVIAGILLFSSQGKKPAEQIAEASPTPTQPLVLSEIPYGVLYGTTNNEGVFIKIYDFVRQKETVLSTLPTNIKKVTVISPTQILYINKTNEYDNGEELVLFDVKQKEPISVIKADNGFVIDEYVFSQNRDFIAVWEIAPNSSGTLIGGRSRVNTIALSEPQVKHRIFDETATYDSPIHYPSAITNDGTVFMDRFLPNSGAGWAYGTTISSFDATQKEELETMKSGTYGTKLSVSSKGDLIAFGGYDGSKGDGLAITDGFRTAVVYVNTIEMLDLQTKRRWKLSNLPKDALFNSINWSYDGSELYFVAITKNPETTGSYVYSLTDQQAQKLQADRKAAIATTLPGNKVLIGTLDDSLGNLGYTYAAPFRTLSVVDNMTGQHASIPLQDGKVQFISAVDHTTFPDVLGEATSGNTLIAQQGRKNLQLEVYYPPTATPTPLVENRRQQQSDLPTPTPIPNPCVNSVFLTPSADAYVSSAAPSSNFGVSPSIQSEINGLHVGLGTGGQRYETFIQFNLSGASSQNLVSSRLILPTSNGGEGPALFHQTATTWTESGLTYNNKPTMGTLLGTSGQFIYHDGSSSVIVDTSAFHNYVKNNIGNSISVGITIDSTLSPRMFGFWQSEWHVDAARPKLELQYQKAECLTPTRTPTPQNNTTIPTRTPTRTPTPTQRQTIGINPGGSTRTPTPTPQGGVVSCQDIARAQCTAQYPDNIDLRGQCIEDLKPILLQNGQCNSSPLYLYGYAGQQVTITVHTPVYNTDPISKGVYSAVINNNASLTVNNTNVASISFDYVPALRIFEKPKHGSIVRTQDVGFVLSEYAKKLGLNEKETNDLVAYGKKAVTKPYAFISFFDEQTSKLLLPIAFTPQPDTYLNYVFYFKQFNERPTFSTLPPIFPDIQRRIGFTAVEISGMVE